LWSLVVVLVEMEILLKMVEEVVLVVLELELDSL
jgi:hypothetical protein